MTARSHERHARWPAALTAAATLAVLAFGPLASSNTAPASASPDETDCSVATSDHLYANTLCWLNMANLSSEQAASITGQQMTFSLPGGYVMTGNVSVDGSPVHAQRLPLTGAYLGDGHYTGVDGNPALQQVQGDGSTTVTISGIEMRDVNGDPVTDYTIVAADAESTGENETVRWESDQPLNLVSELGNACAAGFIGHTTTNVLCRGEGTEQKTGTAILSTTNSETISITMTGQQAQAVAFGVLTSTIQLHQALHGQRIREDDQFSIQIGRDGDHAFASAETGDTNTATTQPVTVLTSTTGTEFTLTETAVHGSLDGYTAAWTCTRNGTTDPDLPAGTSHRTTADVVVSAGDTVECTITNAAENNPIVVTQQSTADATTRPGDTVMFTLDATNTGAAAHDQLTIVADLTETLDDARFDRIVTTVRTGVLDPPEPATFTAPFVSWAGPLEAGTTLTVTYTVIVGSSGDGRMMSTAFATDSTDPGDWVAPNCDASAAPCDTSVALIPKLTLSTTASRASPQPGEPVTFTVAATNIGPGAYSAAAPAYFTVDLTDALDDTEQLDLDQLSSDVGTVTYSTPRITWAGELEPHEAATVSYTLTYTGYGNEAAVSQVYATTNPVDPSTPLSCDSPAVVVCASSGLFTPSVTIEHIKANDADSTVRPETFVAGEATGFTYLVANTGNVPLTDVHVDNNLGMQVTCPRTDLGIGEQMTCTGSGRLGLGLFGTVH